MVRKGISPLIAAVLLIAFTIAVAGLAGPYLTEITSEAQKGTSEDLNTVTSTGDVRLEVTSVEFNKDTGDYTVSIRNSGTSAGENFTATITGNDNPVQKRIDTKLEAGEIHTFTVSSSHSSKANTLAVQSRNQPAKTDYDLANAETVSVTFDKAYIISSRSDWDSGSFNGTTAYKPKTQDTLSIGYRNGTASDSLMGYWRLDKSSGTVVDYSGNGESGSTASTEGDERGKVGVFGTNGVDFDTDDSIDTTATLSDYPFAFSFWFKTSSSNSGTLVSAYDDGVNDGVYIDQLGSSSSNKIEIKYEKGSSSNGDRIRTTQSYNDGNWHHIVVTKNTQGTGDFYVYVDGTKDTNVAETNNHGALDSARNVRIGNHQTNNNEGFSKKIDEVRYYDKALSSSEVKKLYKYGTPYHGKYSSTKIDKSSTNNWGYLEVDVSSLPSSADLSANFSALDSSGNLVEDQIITIDSSSPKNYTINIQDSEDAKVSFNGTSSNVAETWEVSEAKVWYN